MIHRLMESRVSEEHLIQYRQVIFERNLYIHLLIYYVSIFWWVAMFCNSIKRVFVCKNMRIIFWLINSSNYYWLWMKMQLAQQCYHSLQKFASHNLRYLFKQIRIHNFNNKSLADIHTHYLGWEFDQKHKKYISYSNHHCRCYNARDISECLFWFHEYPNFLE